MSQTNEQIPDAIWVDDRREALENIQHGITESFSMGMSTFRWLQLAKIIGVDKDADGRWTGRVTVQLLQNEASRGLVTLGLPWASQAGYIGGVPEIETVVVLGWVQAGLPVILCQVPFPPLILEKNKALPRLVEGEVLIRGSVRDPDVKHQEPGGSFLSDRYGRVVVASRKATAEIDLGADPSDTSILLRVTVRDSSGNTKCQLTMSDSGVVTLTAETLNIDADVSIGDPVSYGTLVTRQWVENTFKTHTHPAPGGTTSVPSPISDSGYTEKLRSQ